MKKRNIAIGTAIACLLLAACGQNTDKETVRVAEVTRSVFYAPFYLAIAEGYFADNGIDIELTTTWGGDKTMTSLLSDGAEIALVGSETSIYVASQEAADPAINFAALTQTDGTFLVAREDTGDFQWEDLKGSTFLGQRKGGMPQMVGEYVLKQHNIDPHADLELLQNIEFANISSSFASGTGDYVQLFEPQASLFEEEGIGTVVASFGTEAKQVPYTSFMAKQSVLDQNADLFVRFSAALYEGQKQIQSQSPEETAKAIEPFFEDTPIAILASSVERYKEQGSYAEDPVLTEEAWAQLLEIMEEAGELPEPIPFSELVNDEISKQGME
ncbi:ABC transporter substrate-binding protein [Shouchella clausii]|uniref:ABC transporter substrate-binding protein n=1 Tax=Shouchella clausii TaxID=79880 RepID=UPI000B96F574|nr:ABC transporter substrate-binding protein [Shouchella clausii]AST96916.1 hypothetical protein BC8716_13535 [Shouchella clausii]MBU8597605.1 ABC transporter substrate-binding protein [Shouchella clausii]MCR1289785.1 ABC transporter substrate-binding protein [Shouchella clausii]MEB5475187.1 ABC transporter substrate-binding protein [Shouchella clausii]MED4159568.1 ABC transporter substrate-binding protein [Shouchella clausii]